MVESEQERIGYWRGRVDQRLEDIDARLGVMENQMNQLIQKVDLLAKNGQAHKPVENGDQYITWRFIREKFAVPLLVAFLTFLLFTILPGVLYLLNLTGGS